MNVAYFTPLPPQKTGIADYSEELLPSLSMHANVDIFINDDQVVSEYISSNFKVYKISQFHQELYASYDEVIYQIGNNPLYHEQIYASALKYPGVIVLHDYALHHLIAEITVGRNNWDSYIDEMDYNYGDLGKRMALEIRAMKRKAIWETAYSLSFPVNRRIINRSKGVIVHSAFAYNEILKTKEDAFVKIAPLFTDQITRIDEDEKTDLRRRYMIPEDATVFGSFGFITEAKRIHVVLEELRNLVKVQKQLFYIIVGEEKEEVYAIGRRIKELGLEGHVKITGFTTLSEFKDYIKLTDVCVNLRYPTQGETSASLIRILGFGKPAIVSHVGSFAEFPDSCTLKVGVNSEQEEKKDLRDAMQFFLQKSNRDKFGENAFNYIQKHHHVAGTAEKYMEALHELKGAAYTQEARFYYSYLDAYSSSCADLVALADDDYLTELCVKFEDVIH